MINKINNTTSKANPPAKPQVPSYLITIVPLLDQRIKLGFIPWILTDLIYGYAMFLTIN